MNNSSKSTQKSFGVTEPQLIEFEFDWKIKEFSQYPSVAVVESPIFKGGPAKWRITMNPFSAYFVGKREADDKGGIKFVLSSIETIPVNWQVKPELTIVSDTTILRPFYPATANQKFYKWEDIAKVGTYFSNTNFPGDILRLVCKVKLYNTELVKSELLQGSLVKEPSDKFLKDWTRLFQSMEHTDISIRVGGDTLMAHKAILSIRSTVFERMFTVEMKELEENVVQIDDFEVEDVKAMLEFIYTGQTGAVEKNAEILLQMAEKYNLPDLKSACGAQLSQGVTIENAIERFYLADRIDVPSLKSFVVNFIVRNKKEIVKAEAFKELAASGRFLELFANIFAQV